MRQRTGAARPADATLPRPVLRHAGQHRPPALHHHAARRARWVQHAALQQRPGRLPGRRPQAGGQSPWTTRLLRQGLPFIGRDAAAIRAHFADHETILALGCESVLNLPVLWDGQVLGTVNLLHGPSHFTDEHARAGMVLAAWAAPALLSHP